jgi:hypothetical protein
MAAVGLICLSAVLVASGLFTWFTSTIKPVGTRTFASHTFAGFHAGLASAWFASIPVGWALLGAALVLSALALLIVRNSRATWLYRALLGCCVLSAATFVLILIERSHVHSQIITNLRNAAAPLIAQGPQYKALAEAQLAGLEVHDRGGVWMALAAAAGTTAVLVFIVMKSRRSSESPSA